MEKWKNYTKEEINSFLQQSDTKLKFLKALGYTNYNNKAYKRIKEEYPDLDYSKIELYHKGEDLTGKRFGRLIVLYRDYSVKRPHWICQCDCGNITKPIAGYSLKNGITKSCGCLQKETASEYNLDDLIGKKFGYLTVIKRDNSKQWDRPHWICQCDCGKIKEKSVSSGDLKSGHTYSCGCLKKSKGELKIEEILKSLNIKYIPQYSFKDLKGTSQPLRFDFAIFQEDELKILIEYQGEQHYNNFAYFNKRNDFQKRIGYDEKKRQYCKDNDIQLIEIPYWDFNIINKDYLIKKMESLHLDF